MLEDVTYPGGKAGAGVYQKLLNLMPPHRVYIEPFLGGGAAMRLKRPAAVNIGVDLDPAALEMTMQACTAETGERRRRDRPSPDPAVSADIAGSGAGSSRFRLEVGDGIAFLRAYNFRGDELVYCDPPYLMETRSQQRRLYRHEMTDVDHRRFLRVVMSIPSMVMISGYWSQMYSRALAGWNKISFQAMTRGGRPATEWVWYNFPRPVELHDYRYLGSDFRERERIKRKKQRWTARLARMPILERQALLCAIADTAGRGDVTRSGPIA